VNSVLVRSTRQILRNIQIVERQGMNVSVCAATTHLLESSHWLRLARLFRVEEANDCTRFRSCCQVVACLRKHHGLNSAVVGLEHVVCVLRTVVCNSNVTFLTGWGDKDGLVLSVWIQSAETLWIIAGVNGIDKSQVSEIVHIDSILEHNDNFILAELDGHDSGLE